MSALPPVKRPLDARRRESRVVKAITRKIRAGRFSFSIITESASPRRFATYDAPVGVLVVTGLSDLPQYRAQAARILGCEVVTVYSDMFGTVYQANYVETGPSLREVVAPGLVAVHSVTPRPTASSASPASSTVSHSAAPAGSPNSFSPTRRRSDMTNYLSQATFTRQKAALTRAVNKSKRLAETGETKLAMQVVEREVIKTVGEWNDGGYAWPDDWARWQRALDDSRSWNAPYIDITNPLLGL